MEHSRNSKIPLGLLWSNTSRCAWCQGQFTRRSRAPAPEATTTKTGHGPSQPIAVAREPVRGASPQPASSSPPRIIGRRHRHPLGGLKMRPTPCFCSANGNTAHRPPQTSSPSRVSSPPISFVSSTGPTGRPMIHASRTPTVCANAEGSGRKLRRRLDSASPVASDARCFHSRRANAAPTGPCHKNGARGLRIIFRVAHQSRARRPIDTAPDLASKLLRLGMVAESRVPTLSTSEDIPQPLLVFRFGATRGGQWNNSAYPLPPPSPVVQTPPNTTTHTARTLL